MLEIQEKHGTDGYEELVRAHSNVVMLHITEALDKGTAIGFIAYSYEGDSTVIYDYDDGGDLLLCDGLVRSVLFKSCLKDIHKADFRMPDEKKYDSLLRLGFLKEGCTSANDIDSFMNGCQNCKHKNDQ
jgi:hypothetical protein